MRILFIAMADSIHTARWISQITGQGWDIRLFPSIDCGLIHPDLKHIPVYHTLNGRLGDLNQKLFWQQYRLFRTSRFLLGAQVLPKLWPRRRVLQLCLVIDEFQPDIIHSLEFQAAGYLVSETKRIREKGFPPWIATNWGSDIYYFRQFPDQEKKIRAVLEQCDYYSCECQRDVQLAKDLGLKGSVLPVIPNAGGFDLGLTSRLRQSGPTSERRSIALKGYQHWVGRAIVGLAALERCSDLLREYTVEIHSASPQTRRAAIALQKRTGIRINLIPKGAPHETILSMYGRSRVAIGLSLGDGISTSFLEGLVMGAFPIQSWTACANEWIESGRSGLLVPPDDPEEVEHALRRALTSDELVNTASETNYRTAIMRLNKSALMPIATEFYTYVFNSIKQH